MADRVPENVEPDKKLVLEARDRWKRSSETDWEWRQKSIADFKFRHGDSDNGWQWEDSMRQQRESDRRPCLTMNIVRQHNLQISNTLRKNKSTVEFIGTGNGATQESANVWRDLWSHIEFRSDAQSAYTLARNFQIDAGMGYLRLVSDYVDDNSMEMELRVLPMIDPWTVYRDPDCQQLGTNSDAKFSFVFDTLPNDDFLDAYPEFERLMGTDAIGEGCFIQEGIQKDTTQVCEYFRTQTRPDRLFSFVHRGERITQRASDMHPDVVRGLEESEGTRVRDTHRKEVEWYLIAGETIIDRTIWPGSMIPLIPVPGEITKIEGRFDYKGHTRALKDAQRMYNYNASAQVEFVALQGKTPWIASMEAIEEMEDIWNTANIVNHAVLPYKAYSETGEQLPVPTRTQPPTHAPAYEAGMETAFKQMMMTSGQFENQMGMMGNERTGSAIGKRQEQSDTAVFHFEDNYETSLMHLGRIFLEVAPKIYDTKRVLQIQGNNGADSQLVLDPGARQVYFQEVAENNALISRTLNPKMGKYAVASSVGPAYGSKREQTREALTLILTQSPALAGIVGDLLLESMDFDKARDAAKRLRNMVPPQALGQGPTQNEQALQLQLAQTQEALKKALEHMAKSQLKLVGKDQMRDIDVYKAETDRIKALSDQLPTDPEGLQQLIHQLVQDSMEANLGPIIKANANDIDSTPSAETGLDAPPMGGAQQASDGNYYMRDPTRESKYMQVAPLVQQKSPGGRI